MTEVMGHTTYFETDNKPFDGLTALNSSDFVRLWIDSEKEIYRLKLSRQSDYLDVIDFATLALDEMYNTKELQYQPVTVSGKAYRVSKGGTERFVDGQAEEITSTNLRFGRINFVPVMHQENSDTVERYHAAFRLLPGADDAESPTSHYYMLFDDAYSMEFHGRSVSAVRTDETSRVIADMADDFQAYRQEINALTHVEGERWDALEEKAREFTDRLLPLIENEVSFLIRPDEYTVFERSDGRAKKPKRIDQKDVSIRDSKVIAGAFTKVAIIDTILNPDLVPHIIVENSRDDASYAIPISTPITLSSMQER